MPFTPGAERRRPADLAARVISEVLSPFVVVAGVLVLIAVLTDPHPLRSSVLAVGLISGVPLLLSLAMTRRGAVTDRFIIHRRQRHLFYALAMVSMISGAVLLQVIPAGLHIRTASLLAVGTLVLVMIINLGIKISIHALIAALAAVVVPAHLPGPGVLILVVLGWSAVSWARVHAQRHSLLDVVLGTILGAAAGIAYLLLTGESSLPPV